MTVIAITCVPSPPLRRLVESLAAACTASVYYDTDIVDTTRHTQGLDQDIIKQVIQGRPIAYNHFSHDRERCICGLKKTLIDMICQGSCIFAGMLHQLTPPQVSHIFRILVQMPDTNTAQWIQDAAGNAFPGTGCHHLILQADEILTADQDRGPMGIKAISDRIETALAHHSACQPSNRQLSDLSLNAAVEVALARTCTGIIVDTHDAQVTVTLDQKVMNLSRIQQEIMAQATAVPGVKGVKTKIGPNYYKSSIVKNFDPKPVTGFYNEG